jgi:hypothetical protein
LLKKGVASKTDTHKPILNLLASHLTRRRWLSQFFAMLLGEYQPGDLTLQTLSLSKFSETLAHQHEILVRHPHHDTWNATKKF